METGVGASGGSSAEGSAPVRVRLEATGLELGVPTLQSVVLDQIMPAAEDNDCFAPTANMNPAGALSWCQVQALALSGSQNTNQQGSDTDADFFSATCLYAGISLTDQFRAAGETPPPIGLRNTAQGGHDRRAVDSYGRAEGLRL